MSQLEGEAAVANEPPTGLFFRSPLGTPEMMERLRDKLPEYDWRLGDSDYFRYYYVRGRRGDGVSVRIEPEDEDDEYYLGVFCANMAPRPDRASQVVIAREIHQQVLALVEGVRRRPTAT
jgi:hypothetical protein